MKRPVTAPGTAPVTAPGTAPGTAHVTTPVASAVVTGVVSLRNLPAPAKINLFLHVTGRRADGYHLIETVFQFINLSDTVDLELRYDGLVVRVSDHIKVPEETDLCVRAALLLQKITGTSFGVSISLNKKIPMGGGLGGGSSDAATVLLGLNRLWACGLNRRQLAKIGLQLGADVPVFILGQNAYATGVGEQLLALTLPIHSIIVVKPAAHAPTPAIFRAPELTRNTKPIKIEGFTRASAPSSKASKHNSMRALPGRNDLEAVASNMFPEIATALNGLKDIARQLGLNPDRVRMSGSGACIFLVLNEISGEVARRDASNISSPSDASNIADWASKTAVITQKIREQKLGKVFLVKSLASHPLHKL